jgi:hypothetical protein
MFQRVALTVLVAALVSGLLCRPLPAASPQIPDWVLYESFFYHVAFVERAAQSVDAKGKSGDSGRRAFANDLGLTPRQLSAINPIAADCIGGVAQILKGATTASAAASQGQRQQVVADHVQQLRSAFGGGFAGLDARIRAISRVKAYKLPSGKSKTQKN